MTDEFPQGVEGEIVLDAVLDSLDELFLLFDDEGRLREWNWALPEVTGRTERDLAAMPAGNLVVEDHAERMAGAVAEAVEEGYATADATLRTGGEGTPVEFRMSRCRLGEEGPGVIAVGFNVTARRDRWTRLQELRERSLELMNTQTEAETARVAADAAHGIIGASLSEVYLRRGNALEPVATAPEDPDRTGELSANPDPGSLGVLLHDVFESGRSRHLADTHADDALDGEPAVRSLIVHPLSDHGVVVVSDPAPEAFDDTDATLVEILATSLTTALDRVERESRLRERERRLERQNERLEEFTSVVSHDLRNPLNVASGRLELAREEADSEHLEAVARAHERMEELIEDLLALAREGSSEPDIEPVDLGELVESCWQTVRTREATLSVETDRQVRADRSRLRQLVENLLRNSVEHGGAAPTIAVGDLKGGFYVEDDGPGIPEEDRECVFEAGYSTGEEGTGFGLSIVAEVADTHGWEVTLCESEAGGARFEFTGVEAA